MQFRAGHLTLYWTHYLHVLNTILPTHTIHILYILTEWCAKVVMAYAMIKKGTRTCHAKQWPSIVVKHPAGMCNWFSTTLECFLIRLTILCHPRQNSCSFSTAGYSVPTRFNTDTSSALCPKFPQHAP